MTKYGDFGQNRLSEPKAKYIFKQIVGALHYCHANKIVHRDLKVENLLLDFNWRVKLADFGFSSTFKSNELLDVYCGSPPYCAPVSPFIHFLYLNFFLLLI